LDTGLWRINLKQDNKQVYQPVENNVYELCNTGALFHYLQKALLSPTKYALLQAVKTGHLVTWTVLTEDAIVHTSSKAGAQIPHLPLGDNALRI
jgi:hypothetical protein